MPGAVLSHSLAHPSRRCTPSRVRVRARVRARARARARARVTVRASARVNPNPNLNPNPNPNPSPNPNPNPNPNLNPPSVSGLVKLLNAKADVLFAPSSINSVNSFMQVRT
jgi:hypothetical protein